MTAACAAAFLLLIAPALWNGYPLLQYDTGGYLARWYEGYLVPSRSTVFGLYLHLGEGLHFWPMVAVQCALTVWMVALVLRVFDIARRATACLAVVAVLSIVTTLPFLTSILLTDIFFGLSVLAVHLVIFHRSALTRIETAALVVLISFAAATHSATFAVLLALLAAIAVAMPVLGRRLPLRGLVMSTAAIALGALMLLTSNAAFSGRVAWTPGGYGIAFGRMLQDGIVARYLEDHCPDTHGPEKRNPVFGSGHAPAKPLKLCPYRKDLPANADDFLWGYDDSAFNKLGRFDGLGDEMRTIVLGSLAAYPGMQFTTALRATADQLMMVASGHGIHDKLWHTYGIMERFIRSEVPAMRTARQQQGALDFTRINELHVPVAWASMIGLLLMLWRLWRDPSDDIALLAGSVTAAVLANAFVCGALSGPHDRYGARVAWVATLVILVAAARLSARARDQAPVGHGTVIASP